jgi:hypothetical protein
MNGLTTYWRGQAFFYSLKYGTELSNTRSNSKSDFSWLNSTACNQVHQKSLPKLTCHWEKPPGLFHSGLNFCFFECSLLFLTVFLQSLAPADYADGPDLWPSAYHQAVGVVMFSCSALRHLLRPFLESFSQKTWIGLVCQQAKFKLYNY